MNKKLTLYLVILALSLAATGCDLKTGQATTPSANKQTPEVGNDYPPRLSFIQSYHDPIEKKSTDELKAQLAQQLEAIGGWQGVKETLALDLVPQATSFRQSACPHCREVRKGDPLLLSLKEGGLTCTACQTQVYPSEQFPLSESIELDIHGKSYHTQAYRTEDGHNFLLEDFFNRQRAYMVLHDQREGILTTCYMLYERTHEAQYAEHCITMLLGLARNAPGVVLTQFDLSGKSAYFPNYAGAWRTILGMGFHGKPEVSRYWLLAFDAVRDRDDLWAAHGDPAARKEQVRQALIERHEYYTAEAMSGINQPWQQLYSNLGNIFAQSLRSMVATAVYCDYPKALVDAAHYLDATNRIYSCFDGVEIEPYSYQAQVVGHLNLSLSAFNIALPALLRKGQLDEDSPESAYVQEVMQKAREIRRAESYYPNGDVVRIGDTWGTHSLNKTNFRPGPYQTENAWGFFPLVSQNRTYACMTLFPQKDSHHHQDDLAMVLWGSGRELMPDYGYNLAYYRNFSVNREGHNGSDVRWRAKPRLDAEALELEAAAESDKAARGPHVYPKRDIVFERQENYDGDVDFETLIRDRTAKFSSYSDKESLKRFEAWRRVAMFDYVPEGLIAYADAASPGPIEDGVRTRNRLLMLIPIHATAAYVADIHRIAGGHLHQVGLQAPFGETIAPHYQAAPADQKRAQASIDTWKVPSKSVFNYQTAYDGSQPFDLTWETETSQVWLKVHSPGTEGALLLSGESPDQTRDPFHKTWDRPKDAPAVPHRPHVFVRRESPAQNGSDQLSSMFPLIYEHGRLAETNTDRITGVERLDLAWNSAETMQPHLAPIALRITFASGRVDVLYTSQDEVERSIGNFTFKGRGVWLSFNKSKIADQPWAGLCMRASSVRSGDGDFQLSADMQQAEVLSADYRDGKEGRFGRFQVRGSILDPAKYIGKWGRVDYGHDVSYVYAIHDIHPTDDPQIWTIEVEGRPGLEKRAGKWIHSGYPFIQASERAVFQFNDNAQFYSPEFLQSVGEKIAVE